jgi:phage recombination protein Bet
MTESAVATLSAGEMLRGMNTVRGVLAPDLNDEELRLFAMVANRSGLDPFAKQIYAVKRKGRVTFQTGIDGYRSIAVRTGMYDGQDEPEYGPPCPCGEDRPKGHPEFATVRVYRKGVGRAIAATAYWHEYIPAAGQSGEGDVMWRRMPRVMIAKVAEALALRKAFP